MTFLESFIIDFNFLYLFLHALFNHFWSFYLPCRFSSFVLEDDLTAMELSIIEAIPCEAFVLMCELFVDDRADFTFEIYFIELGLGVRTRLFLIFLVIMKKLIIIFFNSFLRLLEFWRFLVNKETKSDKNRLCHAKDIERMKLFSLMIYPFSKA